MLCLTSYLVSELTSRNLSYIRKTMQMSPPCISTGGLKTAVAIVAKLIRKNTAHGLHPHFQLNSGQQIYLPVAWK